MGSREITDSASFDAIRRGREGYVFNADGRKLHAVSCETVATMGLGTTKLFFATADEAVAELDTAYGGGGWSWCPLPVCRREAARLPGRSENSEETSEVERAAALVAAFMGEVEPVVDAPASGTEFAESDPGGRLVTAWADESVAFPPKTQAQVVLRDGLLRRLPTLRARESELLHAVFFGRKHPAADVENLLLYNIDSGGSVFAGAARWGLRFEHCPDAVPRSPKGLAKACAYAYRLVPASDPWSHWTPSRALAAWRAADLGPLRGDKTLEAVWLAMHNAEVVIHGPARLASQPFGVRLVLSPPAGRTGSAAALTKGLLDGVVCSLQTHRRTATREEMAARVAGIVGAPASVTARLLCRESRAVLGGVEQLLWARGAGVQWNPGDTELVAAEVALGEAAGATWHLAGEVTEVQPLGSAG